MYFQLWGTFIPLPRNQNPHVLLLVFLALPELTKAICLDLMYVPSEMMPGESRPLLVGRPFYTPGWP